MQRDIACLRNIGIMSSVDVGSTTCRERIVGVADDARRSDGERARGASVPALPAITLSWTPLSGCLAGEETSVTLLETDALAALDGALFALDGARGSVESREAAFRAARARGVPAVAFVDDVGDIADLEATAAALEQELASPAVLVHVPWRDDDGVHVVDVLEQRLVVERGGGLGRELRRVPPAARHVVARMRRRLVDLCAELDEAVRGASAVGVDVGAYELARVLRRATRAREGSVIPVTCGSLRARRGVGLLLDALVSYLPSPAERPPALGADPRRGVTVARFACGEDPVSAYAFASTDDRALGRLTWLRVQSGTLRAREPLLVLPRDRRGAFEQLFISAREGFERIEEAGPGSVVCATGFPEVSAGETLSDLRAPVVFAQTPSSGPKRRSAAAGTHAT
ncbi:MAG: TetM/TetW/TetO/TetS family tetracycline resistance ribosomal protection protein [Labilithrix sp.]|nr:TetM/TetW/TetO/TetS family tetracycline resistance ribosomal protection protein [Labilithrix sp.]